MFILLSGLHDTRSYFDDIVARSYGFFRQLRTIALLFIKCIRYNLKIHPGKTSLFAKEGKLLGFQITQHGIAIAEDLIDKIRAFPIPTKIKAVRSFLGLTGFIQGLLPKYGKAAAVLSDIISLPKFSFGEKEILAFESIKTMCHKDQILAFADYSKPFYMYCDASGLAIAAVLIQPVSHEDIQTEYRIISIMHKKLSASQRIYGTTKREIFSIFTGLRKFRKLILGIPLRVLTDHKPAVDMFYSVSDTPDLMISRWMQEISSYQVDMQYISGATNVLADYFSRLLRLTSEEDNQEEDSQEEKDAKENLWQEAKQFYDNLVSNLKNESTTNKRIPNIRKYSLNSGVILYKEKHADKFVLRPEDLKDHIDYIHKYMHISAQKTYQLISEEHHFPKLFDLINDCLQKCIICQQVNAYPTSNTVWPVIPRLPNTIFQEVFMDIIELPITTRGFIYALVMIATRPGYIKSTALKNKEATTVLDAFIHDWILVFGPPLKLRTDQGSEFDAKICQLAYKSFGIYWKSSSAYTPNAQGAVEIRNRSLKNDLKKRILQHPAEWDTLLDQSVFFLNIQPSGWRKLSPYEIVFCTKPNLPLDIQVRFDKGDYLDPSTDSDSNMDNYFFHRFTLAKEISAALTSQYQKHTNAQLEKNGLPYTVGNKVWKRDHNASGLDPKFVGPYKIIELGWNSALLEEVGSKQLTRANFKDLKPASDLGEECKDVKI
jgi:transposase InsO family protein